MPIKHLMAYNSVWRHVQIDVHVGGVNDLAFTYPNKQLCIATCGDDKLIKVWDLTGQKLINFEGHGAPVYSVCPHQKENIQFIFSTDVDGKIKAWLYDNLGYRVDYDSPGQWCTTMLYSTDGSRLFSRGTSKNGDSFLVECNEREGTLKRTYSGFRKKSAGIVQFDTTKSHFLAAGEDNQIKFWHMDNTNVLTSTDAEGGLPSVPRLRFNKEANLLVVTTTDIGMKILANSDGIEYLRAIEAQSYEASKAPVVTKVFICYNSPSSPSASLTNLIFWFTCCLVFYS
ncbi:WD40/YVTN repeat-like-containing domain superfamily [Sesbania bispinosa]|nr:WD40/YVTN repeat-like-containing domain superfamily [Sesbania bispinosa]